MYRLINFILILMPLLANGQGRRVVCLDRDWLFGRDSLFVDAQSISVPHDFQIEQPWVAPAADERADNSDVAANVRSRLSARGFKEMGTGWYKKTLRLDSAEVKDRRVVLDFEGIMLVGDVYLNGVRVGGTDYGYLGCEIDITKELRIGEDNVLVVKASTMGEKNSRWYTGGGLYRHVRMVTMPEDLHFERHPLHITTHDNRYVTLTAELTAKGKERNVSMRVCIYDPNGRMVAESTTKAKRLSATEPWEARLGEIRIENPMLWGVETPNLYKAVVTLMREDGTVADVAEERFGIRTIEIGPDYGLRLNGEKVLLKGYANHHTLGVLGAAAYPRAIEKRIQMMKEYGVNHIRTSHNPYSREFIQLCDRYGILVVDELYDKWTDRYVGGRSPWERHWQQDLTEWVKRDRNSPSVVMWSLGNELQQIYDTRYHDHGVTAYLLQKTLLQRYDSTRLTTVAMHPRYRNAETDSLPCDLAMRTDVQAYNYRYRYFDGDGRRYPWMTFYQSEANTRDMGENYYGMNLDRVIGLAYWGAIDYLGESQGWPAKGWAQGVFDISLQPKPKAYLMKSMFSDEPMVHLAVVENEVGNNETWNGVMTANNRLTENWKRNKGERVTLYTYTNAEEVELLINGKSVGRKRNSSNAKERNKIVWRDVAYEDGKVEAIARNNGRVVARHSMETYGKVTELTAEPDNPQWKADGIDLQHVLVGAVDSKGRKVWSADDVLTFEVEGDATIVGVSNGDICSNELTSDSTHRLWQGTTMVILRAGTKGGTVKLKIKSAYGTKTVNFLVVRS